MIGRRESFQRSFSTTVLALLPSGPLETRQRFAKFHLPTSVKIFSEGDPAEKRRHGMKWETSNGWSESNLSYYHLYDMSSSAPLHLQWHLRGGNVRGNNQTYQEVFPCAHSERLIISITVQAWRESSFLLFREDFEYIFNGHLRSCASEAQTHFQMVFFFFPSILDNDQSWTERASGGSEITRSCSPFILPSRSSLKEGFESRARMID